MKKILERDKGKEVQKRVLRRGREREKVRLGFYKREIYIYIHIKDSLKMKQSFKRRTLKIGYFFIFFYFKKMDALSNFLSLLFASDDE